MLTNWPSVLQAYRKRIRIAACLALIVWGLVMLVSLGCDRGDLTAKQLPNDKRTKENALTSVRQWESTGFPVHWPPASPSDPRYRRPPILQGQLLFAIEPTSGREGQQETKTLPLADSLFLKLILTRPAAEVDRKRWNQELAFPEYEWMSRLRVWDGQQEWLWPNLPYLLRAHGIERLERYGGVDPGKGVDNDFAAVVVRVKNESALASAEWYGGSRRAGRTSIVHVANSDTFSIEVERLKQIAGQGQEISLVIDLIFADFMDWVAPEEWPSEPEFNGGILASAVVVVSWQDGQTRVKSVDFGVPQSATGIDWAAWTESGRQKRLSF